MNSHQLPYLTKLIVFDQFPAFLGTVRCQFEVRYTFNAELSLEPHDYLFVFVILFLGQVDVMKQ